MYTRCPHCTTIFQVSAEQLRLAHGDVPCVTCTQTFNALESLSDDVTALIAAPPIPDTKNDEILDGADTVVDPDRDDDDDEDDNSDQIDDDETAREETLDEADEPDEDDEQSREDMPDEADSEDDARDDPLPDQPDGESEDADIDATDKDENPEDSESEDDELTREDTTDEADSGDDTRDEPLPDLSDIEPEDADSDIPDEDGKPEDSKVLSDSDSDSDSDSEDDTRDQPLPDLSDIEPEEAGIDGVTNEAQPAESLEFNAPEQTWTKYFLTDDENVSPDRDAEKSVGKHESEPWISGTGDGLLENQTGNHSEWQMFLTELDDDPPATATATENVPPFSDEETEPSDDGNTTLNDPFSSQYDDAETDDEVEPSIIPPWLTDEEPDETPRQRRKFLPSWHVLGTFTALALLLVGQLIHYNRDALAAHATHGATVRGLYNLMGAPLYPDWPLDAFEVTGTEAITGRSNQDALDVLANVIVTGRQPVGLPLIRIVLRDRWTNPVASRVFEPHEYLRTFDPANPLVSPGVALPVEVSVADPGTAAMGYIVDVCLPRRKTGLECQIARDPFQ